MADKIEKGRLDTYNVFEVFDNSKGDLDNKYKETIQKLIDSKILIIKYSLDGRVDFTDFFLDTIRERESFHSVNQKTLKSNVRGDFKRVRDTKININNGNVSIDEIDKAIDQLLITQENHLQSFVENNNREELYTSHSILDIKNNFILFPLRVKIGEDILFADIRFTIYKHGYGIFNVSININNELVEDFGNSIWNIPIESAFIPNFLFTYEKKKDTKSSRETFNQASPSDFEYKKIGRCNTLNDAIDKYIKVLQDLLSVKNTFKLNFDTLIITGMTNLPDSFDDDSNLEIKFKKSILRLLNAPVTGNPNHNTLEAILDNSSYSLVDYSKVYANPYRLVNVYSKNIKNQFKESDEGDLINYDDYIENTVYSAAKGDFVFAIEKLLLHKYSNWKYMETFFAKSISPRKLYKLNLNREFELSFETDQIFYGYASARELISFLYEKCLDSNIEKILHEKKRRNLELSDLKRSIITTDFGILATFLTVLFTLLFAIPSIESTVAFFQLKENLVLPIFIALLLILLFSIFLVYNHIVGENIKNTFYTLKYKKRMYRLKKKSKD